jgi:hypothetical protein
MEKFDIYFFKSKENLHTDDWNVQSDADDEYERKVFKKEYEKWEKTLSNITDTEEYNAQYIKCLKKLATYFAFPEVKLKDIGLIKHQETGEYDYRVVSLDEFKANKDIIVKNLFHKCEADFENIDFALNFFYQYFDKWGACWITKEIIEDGISRCNEVIADKSKAATLLPTDDDVYDKYYFTDVRDFRKALKHIEKIMKKKYEVYAIYIVSQC